jgi:hypothetical protein
MRNNIKMGMWIRNDKMGTSNKGLLETPRALG